MPILDSERSKREEVEATAREVLEDNPRPNSSHSASELRGQA
ncbi:MAG: hypothetical protein ACJAZ9_002027 [Neolewinella sp.]|jgi:hypothetical protein